MPEQIAGNLAYYARNSLALFPIPAGSKAPTGIVESFVRDCSTDPAQWARWSEKNPGCNWGVVAGPSKLIIVDIDTKGDRDESWRLWCELCAKWGIPVAMPQVQSARGGWHVYFACDAEGLRQPDAIKKIINVRAGNGYTVAAGSTFEGAPYVLLSDAPPYPTPAALVEHCSRRTKAAPGNNPNVGTRDIGDVSALVKWLAERDAFTAYEDWVGVGMALKLEFGDAGLDVWQLAHDETVTADVEQSKWASFTTEPAPGVQTLNSWLDRAHKMGWRGTVRRSSASMFGADTVAALAKQAGASLPMLAGQAELTAVGEPIIAEFLAGTMDAPPRPLCVDYPHLPEAVAGHGLYMPLRDAIDRIIAMAERPGWKPSRVNDALALLMLVHQDTFDAMCRRLRAFGVTLQETKIKQIANAIGDKVQRAFVQLGDWIRDVKGQPESDNPDNVKVLLGIVSAEVRWNAWLDRAEIQGGIGVTDYQNGPEWPAWTYIDDTVKAKLSYRAKRTGTRFRPADSFLWESLLAIAHGNIYDPVIERLNELAGAWDGTPRLAIWLSATCGVPCDLYHQAVARNIVGGMVRRAREPGCKHDTMPILYGPQGTGKSTMARLLALTDAWFTDNILFGEASKELVLSLAGKLVVEISEMGMRGSANSAHVKAMISRQVDAGRTAYARAVTERARRNIFIGTTNDDEPLTDPTGNRRFLPVKVDREIDLAWLAANVAQIVGEAARKHSAGESFDIPRNVWSEAAERQEAARAVTDVETLLAEWFAETEFTGPVTYVMASDLVHLTTIAGWRNGGATVARGAVMKRMGFRQEKPVMNGKRVTIWARGGIGLGPADLVRQGTRYMVGQDSSGRPRVEIRREGADVISGPIVLPPLPR